MIRKLFFKSIFVLLTIGVCTTPKLYSQSITDTIVVRNVDSVLVNGAIVTKDVILTKVNGAYEVGSVMQLRAISKYLSISIKNHFTDTTICLKQDIAFQPSDNIYDFDESIGNESNFIPIGGWSSATANNGAICFKGVFDGKNHKITGLRIKKQTTLENNNYVGLFGYSDKGTIRNIGIEDAQLSGYDYVGGICGYNYNQSLIENCYVVQSAILGNNNIGGLSGKNATAIATTNNCYVSSSTIAGYQFVGGMLGYNDNTCKVTNCYSTNKVSRTSGSKKSFGGLIGYNNGGVFTNSYSLDEWQGNVISSPSGSQGISTKTSTQMQADDFITTLGITTYKKDYSGLYANSGYPIFVWQDSKNIYNNETITVIDGTKPSSIIIKDGGSLINNSTTAISATIEKSLHGNKWNLVGNPIGGDAELTALDYSTSTINENSYTNNTQGYELAMIRYLYEDNAWYDNNNQMMYLGTTSNINVGEGYFVWPFGDKITEQSNSNLLFNADTKVITKTNIGAACEINGLETGWWYVLSNPYPANMYVEKFLVGNSVQGSIVYTYLADGTWSTASPIIKAAEGFMVACNNAQNVAKSFTLAKSYLYPTDAKKIATTKPIKITVTKDALPKECYVQFDYNSSNGFDNKDAFKIIGDNEIMAEPYFVVDNHAIVSNVVKTIPCEYPFNIHSQQAGTVTLTFSNIPRRTNVVLIDNLTETPLTAQTEYTTTIASGENKNRFRIKFVNLASDLDEPQQSEANISLWIANNTMNIEGKDLQQLEVLNILGQRVISQELNANKYTLKLNLKEGIYTAKVKAQGGKTRVEKFIISK